VEDRLHTRVGAVLLVGIAAAIAFVLAIQGRHLRPGMRVSIVLQRIGTLHEGDGVVLAGREIGTIESIRLAPRTSPPAGHGPDDCHKDLTAGLEESTYAVLELWIDRRYTAMLRTDDDFFLNQPGVLGEPYLEVGAPLDRPADAPECPRLAGGDVLRGIDPPRLDRLLAKSFENMQITLELFKNGLPEIDSLSASIHSLRQTIDGLPPLGPVMDGAGTLAKEVRALPAVPSLPPLTGLKAMQDDVTAIRAKLDPLSAALAALGPRAGRFADLGPAIDRARDLVAEGQATLAAAQEIADGLAAGKGTLGAFLHDDELGDDLKAASKALKQQPWRVGHPVDSPPP
jgi:hypothetical protein